MPKPRLSARSISKDRLTELQTQGADSALLDARLDLVTDEGMRKDLAKIENKHRVYPELLPTQASLRWSTKNPNLGGFVREFWQQHAGIIKPDPGEWWLEWDWKGIEARMFTAYAGDEEDVALFKRGADIHEWTCARYLFEWNPNLQPWEDPFSLPADWKGKEDERRVRAKNFRYGVLQYGTDERAILGMPGIESLGLDRHTLVRRARGFLAARPRAVAWKNQIWRTCVEQKVARTFMGHRRHLFGDEEARKKEGLNHIIQGSVANLMAWCLIQIDQTWPTSSLILNKHDGAILAFPTTLPPETITPRVKALVEKEWEVGQGVKMTFPADWRTRE